MRRSAADKNNFQPDMADLRVQLAEANRTIERLKGRKTRVLACGDLPDARSRLAPAEDDHRFYDAFACAKAGMAILDADGRITDQNAAHQSLLGYSDEELLGKTPGFYLEGGREEFGRLLDDLLQSGSYCGEVRCRLRNGRWMDMELSLAIIRNRTGGIDGYTSFMSDITEKRRVEDALRESEERFAAFMNNSSVAAFMRDSQGRYVYVNRAYENMVGMTESEILGKRLPDIWPDEIAKALDQADKQVLSAGHALELHERTLRPGREAKEWLSIKFPFRDTREETFVGGVSIDVTERKSLEEQLRQAQKMEAVGRLAGGIAHDFNNLLTIITGYSDLLLASRGLQQEQRSKIEEVRKAGERAALLTRQLLAFSRKQVMAPKVLDLNSVVENLRRMIERLIGEDIEFVTMPHPGINIVKADPGQVEQIIMNLVVNARDAMPNGGKLTIETANVEFDGEYSRSHLPSLPGHYVMIAVSDTGAGMDAKTKRHIFEPFFTTKEPGKGTGLGLATVYGIVKQSGGFIWAYSELGVGSAFKVYFPRVLDQKALAPVARREPKHLKGTETILLAEDEEALRILIRQTLEHHGYKVLEAADGKEAVESSERYRGPIHLLITDVVMPQMSGRELAEHITSARPETGILYISGYTDDAIIHHGVIDPDIAFLQKPFTPSSLSQKVRQVLIQGSGDKF